MSPTRLSFELERFEYVPATREAGVLRLSGRWRCAVARVVAPPSLLAGRRGELQATMTLPPVEPVAAGPDPALWSAGFGSLKALVEGPGGRWLLRWPDGEIELPQPRVRAQRADADTARREVVAAGPETAADDTARQATAGLLERLDAVRVELERSRAEEHQSQGVLERRSQDERTARVQIERLRAEVQAAQSERNEARAEMEQAFTEADRARAQVAQACAYGESAAAALKRVTERVTALQAALDSSRDEAEQARRNAAGLRVRAASTDARLGEVVRRSERRIAGLLLRLARAEDRAAANVELDRETVERERRGAERLLEIARGRESGDMLPPS